MLHKRIHHGTCRWFISCPAPLHRAETKAGDFQTGAAKSTLVYMSWSLLRISECQIYLTISG